MQRLFVVTLLIVLFIQENLGQTSPEEQVFQFFKNYEDEGPNVALDKLYEPNPWINRSGDAIKKLKNQFSGLTIDFVGNYYGYEKITEKMVGNSLLLKIYMVKFDRQPIRFQFIFYKLQNDWVIYSFKYDGGLSSELEESTKLYMTGSGY